MLGAAEKVENGAETEGDLRLLSGAASSLGRARPKAHAASRSGRLTLAKFASPRDADRDLAGWEHVALAREAGISVPAHELHEIGGRWVVVVERFDRAGERPIGYASAMTMLGRRDGERAGYPEVAEVICAHSPHAMRDLRELWRRITFTVLICNYDDQLRNHGLLRNSSAGWALIPAFDLNPDPSAKDELSTAIEPGDHTASIELLLGVAGLFRLGRGPEPAIRGRSPAMRASTPSSSGWSRRSSIRRPPRAGTGRRMIASVRSECARPASVAVLIVRRHMLDELDETNRIGLSGVSEVVGSKSFSRGRAYARNHRVLTLGWKPGELALTGSVIGTDLYQTTAYFERRGQRLELTDSECSCPIGVDCKHVAALVVAAATGAGAPAPDVLASAPQPADASAAGWEQSLRPLVDRPAQGAGKPLAIELSLEWGDGPRAGAPQLCARLMRPGARGGWVNGSLSWGGLQSWQVREDEYRPDHVALLRELYAVYRAAEGPPHYYGYSYDRERSLDLSACDSRRLWPLLDEAARIDLSLIHATLELGEVCAERRGELLIDVSRDGERGSQVTAQLRVGDEGADDLAPLLFLGSNGHGIVCTERRELDSGSGLDGVPLRLVRLARPAPPALQRMLLDQEPISIPAAELDRFAEEICPTLRHVASVVSSDASFTPPEISAPSLVLNASYGAGHSLELAWEWAYEVGERRRRLPLGHDAAAAGFRDPAAERRILTEPLLDDPSLVPPGLLDGAGRPVDAPVALTGLETMRATTELLPQIAEAGLSVEATGDPADYRDVGDSLEIGVSTAEVAGDRDWFDLGVTISVEQRELPFEPVFAALARGESHLLLDDGAHISLADPRLESLRQLIEEARGLADPESAPLRISRYQAGLWAELVALGVVTEQAEAWRRQAEPVLALEEIGEHDPPATLDAALRGYQREGFGWLASLWGLGLGGILADDMGLGKTVQALALICHARERDPGVGPFLVVAPTSVIANWVTEAARFAPALDVAALTATMSKSNRRIDEVARADVVITSYNLFRLEADSYREAGWAGLILDEAQFVKNHESKTYRCVRELGAPFKLALTGTPMENNLTELWSLLSVTAPGLFPDPKRFAEQYARPIERGGDSERLARLRRRIKPLVKRRRKELVAADLPPKQEQLLEVELRSRHRKLYDRRLQLERQRVLGLIDDFDRNRFTILRSITMLRQLCLHPGLVEEGEHDVPCAKLNALAEQLTEVVGGGHRALVFSQFTGFLAMVRDRLDREGISYCYLDGSTRRRERVIERFKQGDHPVFLISLKAGGFGLNLTEADYCFLLDPWWNPATETQAIDRTHRIGQHRPVMVYRMIARDTIEEKVVALAQRKAKLFSGVMDDGDVFASKLSAEDIRGLFDEPAARRERDRSEPLAEAA